MGYQPIDTVKHKMSTCFIIFELEVRFMVFNATFNNISVISWWSVLLMDETGEL